MTALSFRGPVLLGLAALLALLAGFGLWSTQTRLAGAILAQGQIAGAADRQVVQHPQGGVVTAILVKDGDRVAAGDILLQLDDRALQSELRIVQDRLTELSARAARLTAERDGAPQPDYPPDLLALAATAPDIAAQIDGQTRLFAARRATLTESRDQLQRRIAQIAAEADGISAQRAALETQAALIAEERANQQSLLDKGLVPQSTLLALRREEARLQGQIGELTAALARSRDQMTEVEIQISALLTRQREAAATELRDIGPMVLELTETHRALRERISTLTLRAPAGGIVIGLTVTTPQAVLRAAEPALFIVPQDRPLSITVRIPPLQVDAVAVGQPADLVFSAFPAFDTPRLLGRVTMVSADALADPQTGHAYYLATVELLPGERARLGDRALLPGMPVEVFLQTGSRTPLAYLLEPFTAYFTRALRES
jgi:HlyD family secretion protein